MRLIDLNRLIYSSLVDSKEYRQAKLVVAQYEKAKRDYNKRSKKGYYHYTPKKDTAMVGMLKLLVP